MSQEGRRKRRRGGRANRESRDGVYEAVVRAVKDGASLASVMALAIYLTEEAW
jgi:hypothetical protein